MPAANRFHARVSTLVVIAAIGLSVHPFDAIIGSERTPEELSRAFDKTVKPFLNSYCLGCHGDLRQEAELKLTGFVSMKDVSKSHQTWEIILERLNAEEMPPEDAKRQPSKNERDAVSAWIGALREYDGNRTAGDPGPVLARRLSNAEYNYTIRDLTAVDIQPTKTFPVDPANEAGFDNTGESLTMSPALLKKYLGASRLVADHLVLTQTDLRFAPHPVVTDTDRDKYCVKRIVQFYQTQPTDLSEYFFVCWKYDRHRSNKPDASADSEDTALEEYARQAGVSADYAKLVWHLLNDENAAGPIARLQNMLKKIQSFAGEEEARRACEKCSDYVRALRAKLAPKFENLSTSGIHKGSQTFVLWKNRQYAAHRRKFDRDGLFVEGEDVPEGAPEELILPADEPDRANHLAAIERFCSVFPDAFYVSERGRDYLDVPREKQEKGRLLSAGFHSMMGYFRDDGPLYELILDDNERKTLDRLWQELDFVTSAPTRQYSGFLWFERTDSRYMRDPEFDFARPENKDSASQSMIERLGEVYLEKARRLGDDEVAFQAIADYFARINDQIRWVETERSRAEPLHRKLLIQFAQRAWRRELLPAEVEGIHGFYEQLRGQDRLSHEEAIRDSVVSILMSPHFLYRTDLVSVGDGTRSLNNMELASRLSYFLWSTMPDEELLQSLNSSDNATVDAEIVTAQARRMLADERTRGLATEFAANWLDIRRFEEHNSVDRDRFPEFTDDLRQAMFEEPMRYFVDIIRNDRSVLDLLEGDHTFVNSVLAKHYGIESGDNAGHEWWRVDNAGNYGRGGLLPMSVFLTANSPGLRTSPVKRGYWVVRRLLGERIPPPPPNVPELPADESQLGDISLQEMLARHRDNPSCAGCHDRFDSIGLAFEGYGPVGERRARDLGGRLIEVTARFPGGAEGHGVADLRLYLQEHRQQEFIENFCRKLLSYGLGRSLILSDEPLIVEMQRRLQADEYRFSSLIESIVSSPQFLNKRGQDQLVWEN